jgi:hypothetical protein
MVVKNLNSGPLGCEYVKIFLLYYIWDRPASFIAISEVKSETESSSKILVTTFQIRLHNEAEHEDRPINPGRIFVAECFPEKSKLSQILWKCNVTQAKIQLP